MKKKLNGALYHLMVH